MNGRLLAAVMSSVMTATMLGCGSAADPAAGPGGPTGPTGTPADQAAWLDPHDAVRAGTYPGVTVSPVPSPPLPALAWSSAAAGVAQAWADGCSYAHNPGRGADGTARGENIAASTPGVWPTPAAVVGAWSSEWSDYDYASNACAAGKVCGHYTQVVWRTTGRVGCAKATCSVNSPFGSGSWEFYVCDYEPPGNYVGQRPY